MKMDCNLKLKKWLLFWILEAGPEDKFRRGHIFTFFLVLHVNIVSF